MFELKNAVSKTDRLLPAASPSRSLEERKQRRTMVIALGLLLVALGFVLYRDRDFWFPETQEAEEQPLPQPQQTAPASANAVAQTAAAQPSSAAPVAHKNSRRGKPQPKGSALPESASRDSDAPPMSATTTRTVLPPLEVEVVAGDVHRTVHPGSTSVRVDLQPGSPAQQVAVPPAVSAYTDAASSVTSNAAERVQMSSGTAEVVSRPVRPDYPLLARQMKVQGSVILQVLIGRDGLIQNLHVLSGPPILASAAEEAVKQWHFKPHYEGAESVETQARITVNFTISTN